MTNTDAKKPVTFLFLMGNDSISREKAKQDAIAAIQSFADKPAIERFDPEVMPFSSFSERIITPSLFQTVRIFTVRDVNQFKKDDIDMLKSMFTYDIPDIYMIIESDALRVKKGKERALSKDFEKFIDIFNELSGKHPEKFAFLEFVQPAEYKMAQWLETQTPLLLGRTISHKDAEYLVDLAGSDSAALYSELQKIDIFLPPKKPVDRAAIDTVSGATRLKTQFELAQALGKKDFSKVLETIDSLYMGSVYVPLYISAIFKHFWALFRIAVFAKTNPEDMKKFESSMKRYNKEIQDEIGLKLGVAAGLLSEKQRSSVYPVIVKPGLVGQSCHFTEAQYKKIFKSLGEYDIGIKTGRIDDSKTGFQLLCYRIFKSGDIQEQ
jgi:DNA polymerase III delta subunit